MDQVIAGACVMFLIVLVLCTSYDIHHAQEVRAACIQTVKDKPASEMARVCGVHK